MADQETQIPTGDVQAAPAVLAADDRLQTNPVESHQFAQAQEPPPPAQEPPPPVQQVPAAYLHATSEDITLAVCSAFIISVLSFPASYATMS